MKLGGHEVILLGCIAFVIAVESGLIVAFASAGVVENMLLLGEKKNGGKRVQGKCGNFSFVRVATLFSIMGEHI